MPGAVVALVVVKLQMSRGPAVSLADAAGGPWDAYSLSHGWDTWYSSVALLAAQVCLVSPLAATLAVKSSIVCPGVGP